MQLNPQALKEFIVDKLNVKSYETRQEMGHAAALAVAEGIKKYLSLKGSCTMVFAAAPSQNEFLDALCSFPGIDWPKVVAFHMDEYVGLPAGAPQLFSTYLREHIFNRVKIGKVYFIDGNAANPEEECERYAELIRKNPIDIGCLGIGENGHIAFNDPPVADFNDPKIMKIVQLEERCRMQQVHDGCFPRLEDVPTHALTLTVPALMSCKEIYCMVPGPTKTEAVERTLHGPISTECPATALRKHQKATLFLDAAAAALV
ncbi:MAG: glucosamine-6-phosphate deaminase [Firmicutes bacterium]|nr:glucosamine-6-phosphate deaminase [Bacillota bacterium]